MKHLVANSRKQFILETLKKTGGIKISELAKKLGKSRMTITRDLDELAKDGLLLRVHGGAVSNISRGYEPPYFSRKGLRTGAKQAIAKVANELITEGNTLILDVGSSTRELAQLLKKRKNLTVITPSLEHAMELAGNSLIKLIVTGGVVRVGEMSIVGPISENTINEFNVDKAFIGAGGIDLKAGLTEYNTEDAQVKKSIIENSKQSIVLADSTKLGNVTFSKVISLEQIDILITDSEADSSYINSLEEKGIKVLIAK
ncbi:MAG: DeoR/GlpR transcriptional regulator [Deltaproteobacteria bacterium]|jgi:DeoR/GlpR family transcriptional regulator of sugar metabolism|nr:DeoR/GlpR transcriptional regulator [Deltaproteobacteria bacterium]